MEHDIDTAFAELGLAPGATQAEVKAAWRRLVSQWHPDRNDSAAAVARMQRVNRAAAAIRKAGGARSGAVDAAGDNEGADVAEGAAASDTSNPAEEADARPSGDHAAEPPRTLHRKVKLTLEESAFGCVKVLRGKLAAPCNACIGAGHRLTAGSCLRCDGSGSIRPLSWFAWPAAAVACDACAGSGSTRQPCADCGGSGKATPQRYQVTVRLPSGVRDGDLLGVPAIRGHGAMPPLELSLSVEVQRHPLLALDADGTLRCEMPVDGYRWVAQRGIEVPTLDGPRTIEMRRDQLVYRLRGAGFPVERRGPRGDQVVAIKPVFPKHTTTDQQILLDQLIAITSGPDARDVDPDLSGWNRALAAWKRRSAGA